MFANMFEIINYYRINIIVNTTGAVLAQNIMIRTMDIIYFPRGKVRCSPSEMEVNHLRRERHQLKCRVEEGENLATQLATNQARLGQITRTGGVDHRHSPLGLS